MAHHRLPTVQPFWNVETTCIAFEGTRVIGQGDLKSVVAKVKSIVDRGARGPVLIFDDVSSEPIEVAFNGSLKEVLKRLPMAQPEVETRADDESSSASRPVGRPKLGVVSREVTLLPRHWDWLGSQPGGASVALRKLVEQARKTYADQDRQRLAQESAYRFLSAMAGNWPGFEEATRALFAKKEKQFAELIQPWPAGVRGHAMKLAGRVMG